MIYIFKQNNEARKHSGIRNEKKTENWSITKTLN